MGLNNWPMDKYERRRQRVQELIRLRFANRQARFAEAIGRDANYVSRMLYPPEKAGRKRIAEDMRDTIEQACELAPGWLDMDPGTPIIRARTTAAAEGRPEEVAHTPPWPFEKVSKKDWAALSPSERALIEGVALAILGRSVKHAKRSAATETFQPA